jgi:uncharacterized protein
VAIVSELITYPVKGCAGVALAEAVLTPAGLAHDRTFMVISPDGTFRSQRRDPCLVTIHPAISADGALLSLRAAGVPGISVDVDSTGSRRDITMFGNPYRGIDQGDAAAGWLTAVLGVPSRLVRVPPEHARATKGLTPGTAAYADGNAVLVLSTASLAELNRRIPGNQTVPFSRFRPNIVIDGWDEPHTEDVARRLTAGNAELGFAKLMLRCAVPLVDPDTGGKGGPEPIRTLATYRRVSVESKGTIAFGSGYSVLRPGKLAVGDGVICLLSARSPPGPLSPSAHSLCSAARTASSRSGAAGPGVRSRTEARPPFQRCGTAYRGETGRPASKPTRSPAPPCWNVNGTAPSMPVRPTWVCP